jgi:hypothetical protein
LENQKVANADVVAGDGDGVGRATGAVVARTLRAVVAWSTHRDFAVLDDDFFLYALGTVFVVGVGGLVVRTGVVLLAVQDAVGGAVETVAETVVLAVFVVVSHISAVLLALVAGWGVDRAFFRLNTGSVFFVDDGLAFGEACLGWVVAGLSALVLPAAFCSVLLGEGSGALAEVSLGGVDADVGVDYCSWGVAGGELAVVDAVLDVKLGVGVALVGLTVGSFAVNFDACVAAVVVVDTDVLLSSHACALLLRSVTVFLGDANVLTLGKAVFSTGRGLRTCVSAFPSSVLDSNSFLGLDLGSLGGLLVFIC